MSLPDPEPGLVIRFNYLWGREHRMGRDNARYARPCAIVVAAPPASPGEAPQVMVVPITHSEPEPGSASLELPPAIKRHLRLDGERSWVILDEVNLSAWPGFDVELNQYGDWAYGQLPSAFFDRVRAGVLNAVRMRRLAQIRR